MIKLGIGFLLLAVAAAVVLPYSAILGKLRTDPRTLKLMVIVLALDIVFLSMIAPMILPEAFATIPLP